MNSEIVIIGAGATGLIAARELAKAGKKVTVLEARNRIGGRIMPLDESAFGYPAQGGAEFVHGEASITKSLIKEAGLTYIPESGEIWSTRSGTLSFHKQFIQTNDALKSALKSLKEDISISDFLQRYFSEEKDVDFRNSIIKVVEGYDAADPKLVSTFALRDEWLTKSEWNDGIIKEGYGALLNFLENELKKYSVEIRLNTRVTSVEVGPSEIIVHTDENVDFRAPKIVVTVPLPVLRDIAFKNAPEIQEKLDQASKIGFGHAIKILIKFKNRCWEKILEKDLSKMSFLLCNEKFMTWWTQYPEINNVLTGWMAGPEALNCKSESNEVLLDMALTSLANVFKISGDDLRREIVTFNVINWVSDQFTQGAYSYTTIHTKDAYERLTKSNDNSIYFAGEALFSGDATATVEGALGSGLETANKILNM